MIGFPYGSDGARDGDPLSVRSPAAGEQIPKSTAVVGPGKKRVGREARGHHETEILDR